MQGYDRLGFVEGIFRVEDGKEYLYILKVVTHWKAYRLNMV